MGRPSTLVTHPKISAINAALLAGEPVAAIAKKFGISVPTLYRWKSSSMGRVALASATTQTADAGDIVSTLTASLRDADIVRRAALAQGRTSEALRAAQIVNQLSATLATRLGIDSAETALLLDEGSSVAGALVALIHETPDLATRVADELLRHGEHDLAAEFQALQKQLT